MPKISSFITRLKTKKTQTINPSEETVWERKLMIEKIESNMKVIAHISKQLLAEQQSKNPMKSNIELYERILKKQQAKINEFEIELEKITLKNWEEVNSHQLPNNEDEEENYDMLDDVKEVINEEDEWAIVDLPSTSSNHI